MRAEYLGREVVAAAVKPLVDALLEHGVQPVALPEVTDAYDPRARISWQRLTDLLSQAANRLTESELKAVGAKGLQAPYYRRRLAFAKRFLTLEDTYRFMVFPYRIRDYECMHAAVSVEHDELRISVVLDPRYKPSEAFFTVMLGAAEALPALYDLPEVIVHGQVSGRCLRYEVALPEPIDHLSLLKMRFSRLIRSTYQTFSQNRLYSELAERTFALESALHERDVLLDRLAVDAGTHQRCMDMLDCVVVEYDHLNRVTYVNQYAETLFGYSRAEMMRNPLLILPVEDRGTAQNILENGAKPADGTYAIETVTAGGRRIALESTVRSFVNERGEAGWLAMMREHVSTAEQNVSRMDVSQVGAIADDIVVSEAVKRPVVLLLDADEIAQRITKRVLQQAGFTVDAVTSPKEVLDRLSLALPSALVVAHENPDWVAELQPLHEVPILWLTDDAQAQTFDTRHQWQVSKPYRAEDLISLVHEAIAA